MPSDRRGINERTTSITRLAESSARTRSSGARDGPLGRLWPSAQLARCDSVVPLLGPSLCGGGSARAAAQRLARTGNLALTPASVGQQQRRQKHRCLIAQAIEPPLACLRRAAGGHRRCSVSASESSAVGASFLPPPALSPTQFFSSNHTHTLSLSLLAFSFLPFALLIPAADDRPALYPPPPP